MQIKMQWDKVQALVAQLDSEFAVKKKKKRKQSLGLYLFLSLVALGSISVGSVSSLEKVAVMMGVGSFVAVGLMGMIDAMSESVMKKVNAIQYLLNATVKQTLKDYVEQVINHTPQESKKEVHFFQYKQIQGHNAYLKSKNGDQAEIDGISLYHLDDFMLPSDIFNFIWDFCQSKLTVEHTISCFKDLFENKTLVNELSHLSDNKKIQVAAGIQTFLEDESLLSQLKEKGDIVDLVEVLSYYVARANVTMYIEFDSKIKQFKKELQESSGISVEIKQELQNQLLILEKQDKQYDTYFDNHLNVFVETLQKQTTA